MPKFVLFGFLALVTTITGCSQASFEVAPPKAQGICIPGGGGGNPTNGLVGNLFYLDDNQPRQASVGGMLSIGHKVANPLFMSDLNVPTVHFDVGFQYEDGAFLKREDGVKLTSYFAMNLESRIQLAPGDANGPYQLAIISDDGTILTVDDGSGNSTLINNDGDHPSRLGCAQRPLTLDATSKIPMRIKYYQGPPTQIALVMMWRPWPVSNDPYDSACGMTGNETFFDDNTPGSPPTQVYNNMRIRGWRPLQPANFLLPDGYTNPCQ